jgi:flagellar basal body-associated protein FliL
MTKKIMFAVVGLVAVVAIGGGAFVFLFSGSSADAEAADGEAVEGELDATPEVTPVAVDGKLGPHITLGGRVFNLLVVSGEPPAYLKLETVIEFETFDDQWAYVLHGCVFVPGSGGSACAEEEHTLLATFEEEIGTGRQLIEDAVTSIVSGKTAGEIATPEGKDELREEIRQAVEMVIREPRVRRVLFTDFVTQ